MRIRLAKLALVLCTVVGGLTALAPARVVAGTPSINGIGGIMPAYYDGRLFTINFMKLSSGSTLLAKNSQINTIYMSDPGLPGGHPFVSVLDAILADGFNPLWEEIQISFRVGHTPRQLFSDNDVADAFTSGEITLSGTGELYRCSVIGKPTASRTRGSRSTATSGTHGLTWGQIKSAYR